MAATLKAMRQPVRRLALTVVGLVAADVLGCRRKQSCWLRACPEQRASRCEGLLTIVGVAADAWLST
eukprot:12880821-Alexandrium_andersonii.AAC.1